MVFPKLSQWKQIGKLLKRNEKIWLLAMLFMASGSFLALASGFYINNTKIVPAFGGSFTEAIVGQPRFINPVYSEVSDTDRTITGLIFSGLMKYGKDAQIITDLAESYNISDDGKVYNFILKENIFWHDGQKLTADDIVFTVQTIQSPEYKSPLRVSWMDVDVQKNSDRSVTFRLKNPYNSFLENCTLKIIPRHIWKEILPENFTLSAYNLKPVGSGPYKFKSIKQSSAGLVDILELAANTKYYGNIPYIVRLSFKFFADKESLEKASRQRTIDGFSLPQLEISLRQAEKKINQEWISSEKFSSYSFTLPRYFAVFFNQQKQKILTDSNLRQAIIFATNKDELIKEINGQDFGSIKIASSPIMPEFFGFAEPATTNSFDIEASKKLLDKAGFTENSSGQRAKELKKTPAFQFKNYLSSVSKGNEVIELQKCLAKLGFSEHLAGETNGTYGKATENAVTAFQEKYLPAEKPTGEIGKISRAKLNELCFADTQSLQLLKIKFVTINQPELEKTAQVLATQWQKAGFQVEILSLDISGIKTAIKTRDYDALLYGQALGSQPDLYPFWHSSQISDPGLNLSEVQDKEIDALLKSARENLDFSKKQQDLEKLQNKIISTNSAIFLYSFDYIYWAQEKNMGISGGKITDPSKRFSDIENWYIKTKRVWK